MILAKNETWLLAAGYSVTKEDIRLKLNSKFMIAITQKRATV